MDADVNSSDPAARYPPNPQRVSVFIDYNGAVISEKAWGGEFPTYILSSVRTSNRMWASGDVSVMTAEADGSNGYKMYTTPGAYARTLRIFGNRMYIHNNVRLQQIGTDLTPSDSATTLIENAGSFMHDFHMFDVSASVKGYDTVFFVDNDSNTLIKWTFDGTTWTSQGSSTISGSVSALTGHVDSNGDIILYVTTKTSIIKFNGLTEVATIVTGGQFAGASMVPTHLCSDGSQTVSIGETDVDCGGNVCERCANGKSCTTSLDCLENTCVNSVCGKSLQSTNSLALTPIEKVFFPFIEN
jgi:hypothetical protein